MAGKFLTLRDSLLPVVDIIRAVPAIFGLRPHTVTIIQRVWSGNALGRGYKTDVETGLKIDLGIGQVKVRNVSQREVIASGGAYTDQDIVVGPLTPPYTGSTSDGDAINVFDPPISASPTEILFRVRGPGYSTLGDMFTKLSQRTDQSFRYTFVLRKNGVQF